MPAYFNTTRNGYNPEEVDQYIQNLENIIKSYKEKDEAISAAIVSAQIAADNIIKNSEQAAKEMRKSAVKQLDSIASSIESQKHTISQFQKEYNEFAEKYVRKINNEEFATLHKKVDELDKYFQKLKQDTPDVKTQPKTTSA